jgi:hypothetical protein
MREAMLTGKKSGAETVILILIILQRKRDDTNGHPFLYCKYYTIDYEENSI